MPITRSTATRRCHRIPLALAAGGDHAPFTLRDLRRRWRRTVGFPPGFQLNELLAAFSRRVAA